MRLTVVEIQRGENIMTVFTKHTLVLKRSLAVLHIGQDKPFNGRL